MSMRSRIKTPPIEPTPAPALPPKQVIMYHAEDDDPNRLYTLARLEDSTIDKIARRVVEMLDERKGKKK